MNLIEEITNCCAAQFEDESDVCSNCKEHAGLMEGKDE